MGRPQDTPRVIVEGSAEEATVLTCELFKTAVCDAVDRNGVCNVALAGGTTPHALYQKLATYCTSDELPWDKVQAFFGDERDVPHDHVESNYHMVQRTLLDHVPVPPSRVHPMPADSKDLAAAAAEYEKQIRQKVTARINGVPQFDLILLGMGGDGHTASLFPGTDALAERKKLVIAYFVPVLSRSRMTFTFPLIDAARTILLLVTGADKAEAVAKLLGDDPVAKQHLPAGRIAPTGTFIIVLDPAAARLTQTKK